MELPLDHKVFWFWYLLVSDTLLFRVKDNDTPALSVITEVSSSSEALGNVLWQTQIFISVEICWAAQLAQGENRAPLAK
jgi:hypothetical protein